MATQEMILGVINGAVLSIFWNDVNNKVTAVKMDATGATSSVKVTILDEVTEQPANGPFTFGPGSSLTINIPQGQQKNFQLGPKTMPDGTVVQQLILPKYRFEPA